MSATVKHSPITHKCWKHKKGLKNMDKICNDETGPILLKNRTYSICNYEIGPIVSTTMKQDS